MIAASLKRFSKLLFSALVVLFLFAPPVTAQVLNDVCRETPGATVCQENKPQNPSSNALYGPAGILTKVARILSIVVGIVSIFVIIIAGIRYVLASGDPNHINAARSNLIFAAIGLVVASLAQALVIFVLNKL